MKHSLSTLVLNRDLPCLLFHLPRRGNKSQKKGKGQPGGTESLFSRTNLKRTEYMVVKLS